jgi:hypothetical protein
MTKRELQEDNDDMRKKLEEAYDVIGDALGIDDDSDSEEGDGEDGESDAPDRDEE